MTTRITTDNITDGTVATADIADSNVTTAKIEQGIFSKSPELSTVLKVTLTHDQKMVS